MNWTKFALAVLASGIVVSLTDWFFFGVLFHDKYNTFPEVWRQSQSGNMAVWIVTGFFTSAIFIYTCGYLNLYEIGSALKLAVIIWLAVALPIIVTNALFMKLDPLVAVTHSLGWLTRLAVAAICVGLILKKE